MISKEPIVPFNELDLNRPVATREDIEAVNPHRFEMSLLDGILFEDNISGRCVGYARIPHDAFWARGHFPELTIMPGVLVVESAAQLCSYFALKYRELSSNLIGLGALEEVKFRGPAFPGKNLVVMLHRIRSRPMLIKVRFQAFVDEVLTTEGTMVGIVLPPNLK